MAERKPGAASTRPGGGKSRDKGTRGGRPDASTTTVQRPGRNGGAARNGNGQAKGGTSAAARARAAKAAAAAAAVAAAAAEEDGPSGPPSWLQWTTWALAIVGFGVSVYLTIVHYSTAASLVCPESGTINCEKVVTSPQSIIFGIPVAVYGLAFYVFLLAALSPWAWRKPWPQLHWARIAAMVVGIVFVLYLIYTELFTIKAICLWCTSVHVITFVLFVLIVFSAAAGYRAVEATPSTATT